MTYLQAFASKFYLQIFINSQIKLIFCWVRYAYQGVEGEDTQAKPWRHEVTPARPINSCKKSLLFSPSKPSNNNTTSFACHCSCSCWLPYICWRCSEPILMYTLNLYMLFIIFRENLPAIRALPKMMISWCMQVKMLADPQTTHLTSQLYYLSGYQYLHEGSFT